MDAVVHARLAGTEPLRSFNDEKRSEINTNRVLAGLASGGLSGEEICIYE